MVSAERVEREWTVNLELDGARIRCWYSRRGKQIEQYTTQLEIHHAGAWHPAIRFDNAHGFDHCDVLHADGTQEKTAVFLGGANAAFTRAIQQLRTNWKDHRQRFLKECSP